MVVVDEVSWKMRKTIRLIVWCRGGELSELGRAKRPGVDWSRAFVSLFYNFHLRKNYIFRNSITI